MTVKLAFTTALLDRRELDYEKHIDFFYTMHEVKNMYREGI